jgi:hypothetical protein
MSLLSSRDISASGTLYDGPFGKRKRTKRFKGLLPALVFALAAIAQDAAFSYEKDVNFRAFETYAWIDINDSGQPLDELTANQLRSVVEAELAIQGLQKIDGAQADLFIGYQAAVRKEKKITIYSTGWDSGPGWRPGGEARVHTSMISVGSVVLDIYMPSQKLLVWRGSVSKTIDVNAKPEKREKEVRKGIQRLLKNYPPPQ